MKFSNKNSIARNIRVFYKRMSIDLPVDEVNIINIVHCLCRLKPIDQLKT